MANNDERNNPFRIDQSDGDESAGDSRFNPRSSRQKTSGSSTQQLLPTPSTWSDTTADCPSYNVNADETVPLPSLPPARQLVSTKNEDQISSKPKFHLKTGDPDQLDATLRFGVPRRPPSLARDHSAIDSTITTGYPILITKREYGTTPVLPLKKVSPDFRSVDLTPSRTNTPADPAPFTWNSDQGFDIQSKVKRHVNLPRGARTILLSWLRNHAEQHYLEESDLDQLASRTSLNHEQVRDWFFNAAPGLREALRQALEREAEIMPAKNSVKNSVVGSFLVRWLRVRNETLARCQSDARQDFVNASKDDLAHLDLESAADILVGSQFLDIPINIVDNAPVHPGANVTLTGIPFRTRGSGESSTKRQSADQLTTKPSSPGFLSHKRDASIKGLPDDNDSGETDEESDHPLRKKAKAQSPSSLTLLACPYWKLDSERYSEQNASEKQYRHCASAYLPTIARVKQHLYRVHRAPQYHCFRCFEVFEDLGTLQEHHQAMTGCFCRVSPFAEKFTDHEYRLLQKRWKGKGTTASWFMIWEILFPKQTHPSSPFLELSGRSNLRVPEIPKASYVADFKARAPGLFRKIIDKKHKNEQGFPGLLMQDRETMHSVLNTCLSELLEELDDRDMSKQASSDMCMHYAELNQNAAEASPTQLLNVWDNIWQGLEESSVELKNGTANHHHVDTLPDLPEKGLMTDSNLDWLENPFVDEFFDVDDFLQDHSDLISPSGHVSMITALTTGNLDALVAMQPEPVLPYSRSSMILTTSSKVLAAPNNTEIEQPPDAGLGTAPLYSRPLKPIQLPEIPRLATIAPKDLELKRSLAFSPRQRFFMRMRHGSAKSQRLPEEKENATNAPRYQPNRRPPPLSSQIAVSRPTTQAEDARTSGGPAYPRPPALTEVPEKEI